MNRFFTELKPLTLIALVVVISRCASSDQGGNQLADQLDNGSGNVGGVNTSLNGGNASSSNATSGNSPASNTAAGEHVNNVVEGGSKNNFSGINSGNISNSGNASNASLGESINNATSINSAESSLNAPPVNLPLNSNPVPLNSSSTNLTQSPLNGAPSNVATTENPSNAAAPASVLEPTTIQSTVETNDPKGRAAASPFKNPHMNWPGKGKVKYVTRQLTKHSSPNGPVVGEFEQGEHPLIYQNGNWVELNDGSFVKGNGLSDKGVGYSKRKPSWR
jgi:hypothetical protein